MWLRHRLPPTLRHFLPAPVGNVDLQGCKAGLEGGAIYTSAGILFNAPGRTAVISNSAGGSGGGLMCFSSVAQLTVEAGYNLLVRGNAAGLDGGGIAFDQGASVQNSPISVVSF